MSQEACVLDPAEFPMPGQVRAELDLDSIGLAVRAEGVDWGESAVAQQLVRGRDGESPTDSELTNVDITIPIRVMEEGPVSLAEAAYKLQQKAGLIQKKQGWARRDFDEGGGFAGSLGYRVVSAGLSGLDGWLFANRQDAPDVVLKMSRWPLGYSTEEVVETIVKEEAARALIATYSDTKGSGEGLERWTIENLGAAPWRGLILAKEHYDLVSGATAEPIYAAADLTPKGGAKVKTVEGVELVEHAALTAGWLTILSSEIAGVGHMTHRGPRRLKFRIFDPGAVAGGVELRLLWRSLGSSRWSGDPGNPIVATPLVGDFAIVDLGEARPQVAVLGDERFEWKLLARAPAGSGAIRVHLAEVLSTEQMLELSEPYAPDIAGEPVKSPGTVEDKEGVGTKAWSNPSNAKASDDSRATAELAAGATSHYLWAHNFGFALAEEATIVGIEVNIERSAGELMEDSVVKLAKASAVVGSNFAHKGNLVTGKGFWPLSDATAQYGELGSLWGETWTPADVNASGFGVVLAAKNGGFSADTAKVDRVTITVYYTEGVDEDLVCFASRSIEISSEGVHRQSPEDDVWGRLIEDGFLPTATSSGLEGLATRVVIIPSQGDLGGLADTGTNKLSVVRRVRAGYHFAREAA